MAHMLLIMEPIGQRRTRTEAEGREVYDRMLRWGDSLRARGLLLASESLKSQNEAVDGPFAEAKEMVGGFFLVDCKTREEAIALAAECPAAQWATVEVRALAPCYE